MSDTLRAAIARLSPAERGWLLRQLHATVLASDFRNAAQRNPRVGQLPLLPHVLEGLVAAPRATAGYVPGEGGMSGTPGSGAAPAGLSGSPRGGYGKKKGGGIAVDDFDLGRASRMLGGYDDPAGEDFADPENLRLQMARQSARPTMGNLQGLAVSTDPRRMQPSGMPDVGARLAALRQQQAGLPQTHLQGSNPYAGLIGSGANANPWVGAGGPSLGAMSLGYGMRPQSAIGGGIPWPRTAVGGYGRPSATVNPMKRPSGGYGNGW